MYFHSLFGFLVGAGDAGGAGQVFPRTKERDPYRRLGIDSDASYEEVQDARNYLVDTYRGHTAGVEVGLSCRQKKLNVLGRRRRMGAEVPPFVFRNRQSPPGILFESGRVSPIETVEAIEPFKSGKRSLVSILGFRNGVNRTRLRPFAASIEAAFDKIIQQKLSMRKKVKGMKAAMKKKKEGEDYIPPFMERLKDQFERPDDQTIIRRAVLFAIMIGWAIVSSAQSGPAFQLFVGFGGDPAPFEATHSN